MDVTFDVNDPQVEMFRAHTIEVGRRAPVLRLISYNTVEHVKLYISRKEDPNLIQLMSYVAILRQNTGAVSVEYSKKIGEAAASITNSITSDSHTLSLPRLPGIPNYDGQSQATQDPTVSQAPPSSQSSSPKPVPANLVQPNVLGIQHAGEKRTFSEVS